MVAGGPVPCDGLRRPYQCNGRLCLAAWPAQEEGARRGTQSVPVRLSYVSYLMAISEGGCC